MIMITPKPLTLSIERKNMKVKLGIEEHKKGTAVEENKNEA